MTPFISNRKVYNLNISQDAKDFLAAECAKSPAASTVVFVSSFEEEARERELLSKIMGALKLTADDYLVIDLARHPAIHARHLKTSGFMNISKCLFFGLAPKRAGLNIALPLYVARQLGDLRLMASDPVSSLIKQEGLKRALWSELQKMYAS